MRGSVVAIAILFAGCQGSGGAVSVRWHIIDQTTGQDYDPTDVADATEPACSLTSTGACAVHSATCGSGWAVHCVRLVLADPVTGVDQLAANDTRVEFPCRQREATTPFELPLGTFAISLRTFDPAAPAATEAQTPAPTLRTIRKAQVVNLDVIAIGVHPLPLASADGGCPSDLAP